MAHLEVPGVGDYRERISLYFEDEIVELVFPAPYLNHHPTALSVRRAAQGDLEKVEIRSGFREPFVMELDPSGPPFEGAPQRNPIRKLGATRRFSSPWPARRRSPKSWAPLLLNQDVDNSSALPEPDLSGVPSIYPNTA